MHTIRRLGGRIGMTDEFTSTELIQIALVLGQNIDQYDDAERRREISALETKARTLADDRE